MRTALLGDKDGEKTETDYSFRVNCECTFCEGFGTRPFLYGYVYGILSLLVLYSLAWMLGLTGAAAASSPASTENYGIGVVRGGYRWPSLPMIEPVSRTKFEPEGKGLQSELNMLLGVAIRLKKVVGVNFKVYAVGLYIDPAAARKALKPYKDRNVEALQKTPDFYEKLTNAYGFRRVLELRFLRSVGHDKLRDTFQEGLAVRMRRLQGPKGDVLVNELVSVFTDIKSGQKLIFAVDRGVLSVKVPGKAVVKFPSADLAWAFMDLYFGKNPTVGTEVKEKLIERVPALWNK